METPNLPTLKSSLDTFLSKKEKISGYLLTGGIIIAAVIGLNAILPWLSNMLGNLIAVVGKLITLGIMGIAAAGLVVIALSERTHTLVKIAFARLARGATMTFIKYSPWTIPEIYIEYIDKKARDIYQKITNVLAINNSIKKAHGKNVEIIESNDETCRSLQERYFKNGVWVSEEHHNLFREKASDTDFRTRSNKNLQKQIDRLEFYLTVLKKFEQAFKYRRNVLRNFCDAIVLEYNATKESAEVTRELATLFGTDDMKKVFDMSVQFMQDRMSNFVAETDTFFQTNMSALTEMDLSQDVAEDAYMNRLKQMGDKADLLIEQADQDQKLITSAGSGKDMMKIIMEQKTDGVYVPAGRNTGTFGSKKNYLDI